MKKNSIYSTYYNKKDLSQRPNRRRSPKIVFPAVGQGKFDCRPIGRKKDFFHSFSNPQDKITFFLVVSVKTAQEKPEKQKKAKSVFLTVSLLTRWENLKKELEKVNSTGGFPQKTPGEKKKELPINSFSDHTQLW